MPVSTSVHISHCLNLIISTQPRSVLDVGCGFGLWGFLCREYLDVMCERVQPEQWQIRIDGIELFEPYIQDHQRALYSSIKIGDIRELAPNIDNYDLIIAGDVIEHLEKSEGERVISQLYEKAERALIVGIPLGDGWDHPEAHGNPGELHRSKWEPADFLQYPVLPQDFELPCGKYGVFYLKKEFSQEEKVAGLLNAASYKEGKGDSDAALKFLLEARALEPTNRDAALFLCDVLIRKHDTDEALNVLEEAVSMDADFHYARYAAARILNQLKRPEPAKEHLQEILSSESVSADTRADAESLLRSINP